MSARYDDAVIYGQEHQDGIEVWTQDGGIPAITSFSWLRGVLIQPDGPDKINIQVRIAKAVPSTFPPPFNEVLDDGEVTGLDITKAQARSLAVQLMKMVGPRAATNYPSGDFTVTTAPDDTGVRVYHKAGCQSPMIDLEYGVSFVQVTEAIEQHLITVHS